ncbi:NAD(P)H-dependent glycerol-3-phosphate dehydrogenase [Psychrosphaera aestuarii]|uniref:NAD(P)H-dependent glycerol-3-phosphate dehydrogenase n=1 Tax=Psychrosphaera aestuarii TaxID=1266052 RepID=UPI001B32A981|nr:NAD(P)H-dependent glycerol-3-phosphate dehydrogenase [Psychrosphaera aestuarii]
MDIEKKFKIAVLGAGSYGTALAFCFARNGHDVIMWGRDKKQIAAMQSSRENAKYLPGATFPESLQVTDNLQLAVTQSELHLVVVPSHVFSDLLIQIKPMLPAKPKLCWATKGLDPESGRLLQDVAKDVLGDTPSLAVLSGPTFAKEMVKGLPTAISCSSEDDDFAQLLCDLLHCERKFRVYKNKDFTAVQLGGAVKNVIAIGAGMADGIGYGANARTALITRGLAEMMRLASALGADPQSLMGMAGLGDLVLTCTDNQSRNRRFGLALGQGKSVDDAMAEIGQVVEGYRNTKEVHMLSQRAGVEMPITEQIYQVLYQGKPAEHAAMALLARDPKSE